MTTLSYADESREAAFLKTVFTLARRRARQLLVIEDCDDLAQDVVLDILTALREGRMEIMTEGLSSLVGLIVLHRLLNGIRSGERCRHREDDFARWLSVIDHEWMSGGEPGEEAERWAVLEAALDALPPNGRRAWELMQFEDSTYRGIAQELGLSRASVNRYVVMARRAISTALMAHKAACEREVQQTPAEVAQREGEVAERAAEVAERRGEVAA